MTALLTILGLLKVTHNFIGAIISGLTTFQTSFTAAAHI